MKLSKIGIIGGGPAGLFAAYELVNKLPKTDQIVIFERGKSIEQRLCPIVKNKSDKCLKCSSCAITSGMSGAGAFSDGKYIMSTEYGGWLPDFIGHEKAMEYMKKADTILMRFGATDKVFQPDNELKKIFLQNNLHMLQAECKHLGTDANFEVMKSMIDYLSSKDNVKILTETNVFNVKVHNSGHKFVEFKDKNFQYSLYPDGFDVIIFAVGRAGNGFFNSWCASNHIKTINNQVDIGVRVELPALIWKDFTDRVYEPKLVYKTKQYGDKVRTFCVNPFGAVVMETNNNVISVNGHSYADPSKYTENTNFALLSTTNFTQPFNEPVEYATRIASLSNAISGGGVIIQTLGDLEGGRRTNDHRLSQNAVKPTLKAAVAGDLSLCMPKRQLDNIIETLHAIDKVIPGTANPDTLLYGVEIKTYSARPETNEIFEFECDGMGNFFAIGDGAGFTRSLSQASAQGLYVADAITERIGD